MPAVAQWLNVEPPPNSPGPLMRLNTKDLGAHVADKRARTGAGFAWLALILGLICGAVALLAGPGYRAELLSLSAGLQAIRWAAIGALAGAVMALLALGLSWRVGVRRSMSFAAAALALNALVAGPPLYMYWQAQNLPRIHDISTDTDDPPRFVAVLPVRKGARNQVDYAPETAAQQKRGYPDIAPLRLDATPTQSFERAERAARAMGWEIVSVAPKELRIEATDTTLLFGFKDDVVIRVRPQAQGSIIDVRSLSRVGGSDFGTNAKRIRAFMRKVAAA
jgi:uncharacterized protein (DUF1499 family)